MLYVLLAALFSVIVSITLKLYKKNHFDIYQIIGFNYVSAGILSLVIFKPDFQYVQFATHGWLMILMAILLPTVFWCLDRSLQHAGLIKTEIAQRISVVLTILISMLIYQEVFTPLKIIGIILGIGAVVFMVLEKEKQNKQNNTSNAYVSLMSVWLGYAVIDLLFKYTSSLKFAFSTTISSIFILSSFIMLLFLFIKKTKWQIKSVLAGLLLGVFNLANISFYLQAHRVLKDNPSIVFMSMNISVVILGLIFARIIFKEKLTLNKSLGGLLAIAAVCILMQTM